MPRNYKSTASLVKPDPKFGSMLAAKIINKLMLDGKKSTAQAIFYRTADGRFVLSAAYDATMFLWELESGSVVKRFNGHDYSINSVALSPDGAWAASASTDKTIKLWDLATGAEIRTLEGHDQYISRVVFSPDGRLLLSAGGDGTARLWEVATGRQVHRFSRGRFPVWAVAFSPDGRRAVTGGHDQQQAGGKSAPHR